MWNKAAPLFRVIPRMRNARSMSGGHGVPAHFKPIRQICEENKSHMDFMPVPEGSWHTAHQAKEARNNRLLIGSFTALVATFAMLYSTGCIYLHGAPPAYLKKK